MSRGWRLERLPLLTKDLLEQSIQRRTYVYRAFFALPLYAGGLWLYSSSIAEGMTSLGRGAQVLMQLVCLQIGITFAIVPLLACDSVAGEKERETLELLMLTKLSLRAIILEKFAAHFLSVATLQLLALPLIALAYPMVVAWSIPLATMWLARTCWINPAIRLSKLESSMVAWTNNRIELLTLLVFPSFAVWLGVYCGLQMKTRVQALVSTIGVIAVLWSVPWLLIYLQRPDWLWICPQSPLSPHGLLYVDRGELSLVSLMSRIALLVLTLLGLRAAVHRQFPYHVGRMEGRSA